MNKDKTSQKIKLDERNYIGKPLLDQLVGLDWGLTTQEIKGDTMP
jgi:hypothetical protein